MYLDIKASGSRAHLQAKLPHHRTYGSVFGGSHEFYTDFELFVSTDQSDPS